MLKKVIVLAVLSAILFSSFSFTSLAFEFDENEGKIEGYYLFDTAHNIIMTSKDSDKSISPSSTAKIMTACIVLESNINLDQEVKITSKMLIGVSGRSMYLKNGDVLTVRDLLYAMICGGYNDATHILALTVSDSLYEFTQKMNKKAHELGMSDTYYLNPTGINTEGMHTTIDDIARLAKYMLNNQLFTDISSTKYYKLSDTSICEYKTIINRSSLVAESKGLSNLSTGASDDGDCAVLFYKSSDTSVLSIVMNAKSTEQSSTNCAEKYSKLLIAHALNDYSIRTLKTQTEVITSLPVRYSISGKEINVYLMEDLNVFLPNDASVEKGLTYSINIKDEELVAPLQSEDIIGTFTVFYDGILLATVPLTVNETVERNTFLYTMDLLKHFVLSKVFFIALISCVLLLVIYDLSKKRKLRKKKRKTRKKPT